MSNNRPGPAPLEMHVASRVLDLLATDDAFRSLFQQDPDAALAQAGHRPAASAALASSLVESAPGGGECLAMAPGAELASKEAIQRDREKLMKVMTARFAFDAAAGFTAR